LKRPVRVANDGNYFALSEEIDGAGNGEASVFGVILGTGVRGGLVINGALLAGAPAIAGESDITRYLNC
jgi:fructokinase